MSETTGLAHSGANSLEWLSSRPATSRANSMIADLHAEADAEERELALAGVADGFDHALHAAHAEAAGHEQAVEAVQEFGGALRRW